MIFQQFNLLMQKSGSPERALSAGDRGCAAKKQANERVMELA